MLLDGDGRERLAHGRLFGYSQDGRVRSKGSMSYCIGYVETVTS